LEYGNQICEVGLTESQVAEKIAAGQVNRSVSSKTKSYRQIFKDNLFTFFNILNLVLAVLVFTTGDYKNGTFLLVVIGNLIIGLSQEIASKKTLDRLSLMVAMKARVVRDGTIKTIDMRDVVLSDILILKSGDQICADGILQDGTLEVNESLITGESDVTLKKAGDKVFSGSFVVSGNGKALVIEVGEGSFANKIMAGAKAAGKRKSKLNRDVGIILKSVSYVVIPIGLLMYLRQYSMGYDFSVSISKSVASVIGMIPEGLILLTSISLAASAIILASKKTLVQDLYSVETMARAQVLCLDKTGTITEGNIVLKEIIDLREGNTGELLKLFSGAVQDDNATIRALREYFGSDLAFRPADLVVPFSSERKYSGAYFKETGMIAFGAYDYMFPQKDGRILGRIRELSEQGYRILAVARGKKVPEGYSLPDDIVCTGLVVFRDRIRKDAGTVLDFFYNQGVDIKIISGDDPVTVRNIAKEAGLRTIRCADASSLDDDKSIQEAVLSCNVFGRVTPDQKKRMVAALRRSGKTVAMMGDGVNDVPAIREADCSIAMGSGSDAAKNVADLVLLDSEFAAVPGIISEGRKVVNNIQRVATLFITKTVYALLLAVFTLLVPQMSYPFTPVQLFLISFVTIGFPAFFLSFERNESQIKQGFLLDVFSQAIPGGICAVGSMIAVNAVAVQFHLDAGMVSTICVMLASAAGIWVMVKVSYPFTLSRSIILACSLGIFAAGIYLFPQFFDIVALNSAGLVLTVIGVACMPLIMYVLAHAMKKSILGLYNKAKGLKYSKRYQEKERKERI
jgi:cation-transporting ATPase E